MEIEFDIQSVIDDAMVKENQEEKDKHVGSRKLTAGYLHQPMRFQLLKYLGVPEREINTFSLRKMARGRQVEDWFVSKLETKKGLVVSKQIDVEYRGVIGRADIILDQDLLGMKVGVIPHEIKSVTNKNFKYLAKGDVGDQYKMQAGLYALALEKEYYGLDFIASDDLRSLSFILKTDEIKDEIDGAIDKFEEMVSKKIVPPWEFKMAWQANPEYMRFDPIWTECNEAEFRSRLEQLGISY